MKDHVPRDERMRALRKRPDRSWPQTEDDQPRGRASTAKKAGWVSIIVILVAAALAGSIGQEIAEQFFPTRAQSIEGALSQAAAEINNQGPRQVDSATRLDRALAGPGRTFRYDYTVLGDMGRNMDQARLESSMADVIRRNYCTSESMRSMRAGGVAVTYRYVDETGRLIGQLSVRSQVCL
jgi:hypothetical protein